MHVAMASGYSRWPEVVQATLYGVLKSSAFGAIVERQAICASMVGGGNFCILMTSTVFHDETLTFSIPLLHTVFVMLDLK